jgi:hypothetical protein
MTSHHISPSASHRIGCATCNASHCRIALPQGAFYGLSGIESSIDMAKLGPGKLAAWEPGLEKLAALPLVAGGSGSGGGSKREL